MDQNDRASFAQAMELAVAQQEVELRTPGSIVQEPRRGGKPFLYWHRYNASGTLEKSYVGPAGSLQEEKGRAALYDLLLIREASKKLRKLGFLAADSDTSLTLGALFNAGVFAHGGILVGTHAYAVLLNMLGARVVPYSLTEDVDIAARLELAAPLRKTFMNILKETGLPFLEVPPFNRKHAPTSFKVRGKKLKVDLLVQAKKEFYKPVFVRALGTYAVGLPFLNYLTKNAVQSLVIGKDRLVPVMVPQAGRFCVHKLAVSALRGSTSTKAEKDIFQSAVMAAVIARDREYEIDEAFDEADIAMRKKISEGAAKALKYLEKYPEAAQILVRLIQ